jgi:hypothetical protein
VENQGIIIAKCKDIKPLSVITTFHDTMVTDANTKKEIQKPSCIQEYSLLYTGVQFSHRQIS